MIFSVPPPDARLLFPVRAVPIRVGAIDPVVGGREDDARTVLLHGQRHHRARQPWAARIRGYQDGTVGYGLRSLRAARRAWPAGRPSPGEQAVTGVAARVAGPGGCG